MKNEIDNMKGLHIFQLQIYGEDLSIILHGILEKQGLLQLVLETLEKIRQLEKLNGRIFIKQSFIKWN